MVQGKIKIIKKTKIQNYYAKKRKERQTLNLELKT